MAATPSPPRSSNGVATFNGNSSLEIAASGTYTLTATDGMLTSTNSSSFFDRQFREARLLQQPTQTVAGHSVSPSVTVAIRKTNRAIRSPPIRSTVILTINQGAFADGSKTEDAQAVNGVATFQQPGHRRHRQHHTLKASDGGLQQKPNPTPSISWRWPRSSSLPKSPRNTYAGPEAVNPSVAIAARRDGFGNALPPGIPTM